MAVSESYHTIIVGSGAAGLNCALQLVYRGIDPSRILIITEKLGGGTSFDAGSDKQTYYKLSLVGGSMDSPLSMAHSLYDGGCMHGDIALIEASCSIQAFMHLIQLGVPFPHDKYGAFVGYKTDNDPLQRGTSAGPLTSRLMGECLLRAVKEKGVKILDKILAIEILKSEEGRACGVLALALDELRNKFPGESALNSLNKAVQGYHASFIVLATGGPAGIYSKSVYPESQWGALGLAIRAGAILQNLTESQYGIASLKFRWNLSGTYQQVLPRYISLPASENPLSSTERAVEFLLPLFESPSQMLKAVFLKGYQWPFNPDRIHDHGSSLIDLAIHEETIVKGRRVYLDYRVNPTGYDFDNLNSEVVDYLTKSGAFQASPILRLMHMNPKAVDLYRSHGINLFTEPLEIGVCAQHCNGGIMGDIWWETSVPHLFAIGEANGSHGVHRPGGSALNAGQVGGIRAAEKIVYRLDNAIELFTLPKSNKDIFTKKKAEFIDCILPLLNTTHSDSYSQDEIRREMQDQMMRNAAYLRESDFILKSEESCRNLMHTLWTKCFIKSEDDLIDVIKISDAMYTQFAFLASMRKYLELGGGSRGSYLVVDGANKPAKNSGSDLLGRYRICVDNSALKEEIIQFRLIGSPPNFNNSHLVKFEAKTQKRQSLPEYEPWFETVWREYDARKVWK
jgi:succinate dehydrogenase/fumarate reductase flavoprotein subunit